MSKDKKSSNGAALPFMILMLAFWVLSKIYRLFVDTVIPFFIRFYFEYRWPCIALVSLVATLFILKVGRGMFRFFSPNDPSETKSDVDAGLVIGHSVKGNKPLTISLHHRSLHASAIGATGQGKTEGTIIAMAVDDIKAGRGLILMDGKADRSLLTKLYAYAAKYNRAKDFRVFSLFEPEISSTYNPLLGGSAEEISERIFNSFVFENEYYSDVQRDWFTHVLRIFEKANQRPTFLKISQALSDPRIIRKLAAIGDDPDLMFWANEFCTRTAAEMRKDVSGLVVKVNRFAFGQFAAQFNSEHPSISIQQAMKENLIVYFQLPAMQFEHLGKATARIVMQDLMSQIANRHKGGGGHRFFGVYLDDFAEYLHESFVTVLNKSRSANVGILFAHQAKGDIDALGDAVSNAINTNTNVKIIMRSNEPDTAEYYARMIGTEKSEKTTERRRRSFLSTENTGEMSVREAEEFKFHPGIIKNDLAIGEALVVLPDKGTTRVRLVLLPDLKAVEVPRVEKIQPQDINKHELGLQDLPKEKDVSKQDEKNPSTSSRNNSVLASSDTERNATPESGGTDAA